MSNTAAVDTTSLTIPARTERVIVSMGEDTTWPTTIHLGEGAKLTWIIGVSRESDKSYEQEIALTGRGATLVMRGIVLGKGSGKLSLNQSIHLDSPATKADILFRSAEFDESALVMKGAVMIAKKALGADASYQAHAILMSEKAKADITPSLEILANEVKASHGAAVGELDREQLFYLESRGISHSDAEKMVLGGFLRNAASGLDLQHARALNAFLDKELPSLFQH